MRTRFYAASSGLGRQTERSISTVGAALRIFVIESETLCPIGRPMPSTILFTLSTLTRPAVAMCSAGIVVFLIGAWAAKNDIANARGLDKIVALTNLCFAIPLAVFGAEHLSMAQFIMDAVPHYMPWR